MRRWEIGGDLALTLIVIAALATCTTFKVMNAKAKISCYEAGNPPDACN